MVELFNFRKNCKRKCNKFLQFRDIFWELFLKSLLLNITMRITNSKIN